MSLEDYFPQGVDDETGKLTQTLKPPCLEFSDCRGRLKILALVEKREHVSLIYFILLINKPFPSSLSLSFKATPHAKSSLCICFNSY